MNKVFYLAIAALILVMIFLGVLKTNRDSSNTSNDQSSNFNASQLQDAAEKQPAEDLNP